MADANLHHAVPGAAPNGGNRGGGNLSREYPHRLIGWIDDDLAKAISLAAASEKERTATIVRRWLRFAARQSGFYPQEQSTDGK